MIDYHSTLVSALKTVGIPVHYELVLHSGLPTPCISYQEANNAAEETGDTLGYSSLAYTIKVWHTDLETIQRYAVAIDAVWFAIEKLVLSWLAMFAATELTVWLSILS